MPERQALNGAVPHFVQVRKGQSLLRNLQLSFDCPQVALKQAIGDNRQARPDPPRNFMTPSCCIAAS
jgi:hypothetical protein